MTEKKKVKKSLYEERLCMWVGVCMRERKTEREKERERSVCVKMARAYTHVLIYGYVYENTWKVDIKK